MDQVISSLVCQLDLGLKVAQVPTDSTPGVVNSSNQHFVKNGKMLPCCRRVACNACIRRSCVVRDSRSSLMFECPLCRERTKIKIKSDGGKGGGDECELESGKQQATELDKHIGDINDYLVRKLDTSLKHVSDLLEFRDVYLTRRREHVEHELHMQVEAIKMRLDQIEAEMREQLEVACKSIEARVALKETTVRGSLNTMRAEVEKLKNNPFLFAKSDASVDTVFQRDTADKCMLDLTEVDKVNASIRELIDEISFDPNPEMPSTSCVGHLRRVARLDLKAAMRGVAGSTTSLEQIVRIHMPTKEQNIGSSSGGSNNNNSSASGGNNGALQRVPISPRHVCIADKYNLLFTDGQSRQVVQLKLENGDFVRATNLAGVLKNPDGLCVNKSGHVFVGDTDLNAVFKFDSQFALVKKFGHKELKWPRGITYDRDLDGDHAANKLYVCSYMDGKVQIYNDHEQLRDSLCIDADSHSRIPNPTKQNDDHHFRPINLQLTTAYIYVTDDWTGGNCIRMFDKRSLRLLRNIGNLESWNPLGLVVDDHSNVYTIARLYYETGATHLFCFDKGDRHEFKTNLNIGSEVVSDMCVERSVDSVRKRLVCAAENKIIIFGLS